MSNPTPILNNINAFDATQGTTISFNIIGGTDIVRSNIVYIYDLSTNDLICTHLYISTESIHELPPNTDPSIVYASGKSSADFVNNKNYYLQIQTFTNTAGTAGGSGMSVAKTFWCLFNPALSVNAIPAAISTTSYNVGATYTTNITDVTIPVTNIIQQYKFDLYTATGTLVQTSGNIIGSGEQEGTSTTYNITYNFSGLVVNNSYYVVVTTTSTEGMTVSVQSNTFTVSIDTPTLGEATVVNNACDGYISVTSNLSGEYGGSASGEIASFVTSSINDVSSLKVNLEPIQNGTPWMSAQDTEPYMFRAVPTQTEDFGYESDTIVGGTVAWNQLVQNGNFANDTGWGTRYATISIADGIATFTPSSEGTARGIVQGDMGEYAKANHKYLGLATVKPPKQIQLNLSIVGSGGGHTIIPANVWTTFGQIFTYSNPTFKERLAIYCETNLTTSDTIQIRNAQLIDLTAMFGSTIADYIYSLEQATAGAGVAWFRNYFPKDYYPYDPGTLRSVEGVSAHETVGFNQWDEEWENGYYSRDTGNKAGNSDTKYFRSKNYIPCLPSTGYYFKAPATHASNNTWYAVLFYDADKNFISARTDLATYPTKTTPANAYYMTFYVEVGTSGATYNHDICINISKTTGTPKNGDYVPYTKHTYALDSDLVLRGIPKLDANNNLYYDGDTYASDGGVTRKYGVAVLNGSEPSWGKSGGALNGYYVRMDSGSWQSDGYMKANAPVIALGYTYTNNVQTYFNNYGYTFTDSTIGFNINPAICGSTMEEFKAWLAQNPITVIYELATPTTETADPYTSPQVVDPSGTEEYVGSPIPVGHKTTYQRICPITGWTGCEVVQTSRNLFNGSYDVMYKLPEPIAKGTWVTASAKTSGNTQIYYYDENRAQIDYFTLNQTDPNDSSRRYRTFQMSKYETQAVPYYIKFTSVSAIDMQFELSSENALPTPYEAPTVYPVSWQTEAGTVYGGTVDVVTGVLTVTWVSDTKQWNEYIAEHAPTGNIFKRRTFQISNNAVSGSDHSITNCIATYNVGTPTTIPFYYVFDNYFYAWLPVDIADDFSLQLVYELATPQTYQLTPTQIQTLVGVNNVWSDAGEVEVTYNIPITNLLVKRQDVADVSGAWLTLYSQPITQASDMDFTFIDFLNQYGKTYKYALVPLLTQTQSGVVVQIEGGYTVSDDVLSVFDGVFIANSNGSQKLKAATEYGDLETNQDVGVLTTIGGKYPFVVSNSNLNYHSGSISALIVPSDFYTSGDLDRLSIVERREAIEQFLTDKTAKILKDWNGNIWLITFVENVEVSFVDDYGMGLGTLSAKWVEIGDVNDQTDLKQTGLI